MARTQEERKADTRARLLAAGSQLFGARGFHAVSTDAVADAAGRTSGAVYAHFGGKEGLLLALVNAWENATAQEVSAALVDADDLDGRLGALWQAFVASADDDERSWMLLEHELWLYGARNPEAGAGLAARYAEARAGMAEAFTEWAEADERPGVDGGTTAVLAFALLLGLEMQRRVDPAAVPDGLAVAGLRSIFGVEAPVAIPSPSPAPNHPRSVRAAR